MARGGAPTPSKRKEKEGGAAVSAEEKVEEAESKRLREIAFSRKLLSRSRSHVQHPSQPSKSIFNSDGKDIVKKGHRKSKYLFTFPGLLSPISGGKLGELTNLDSKNPVLYVDFPQGRLKLFGTIMYPKNKYLTLHFQRGAGSIVCEDCFESLIVFSQAWWIGTKEQNPEEVRLPLPKGLEQEKHTVVDFTAGAGQTKDFNRNTCQLQKSDATCEPDAAAKPEVSEEAESIGKDSDVQVINQSVRQSARNAGKTLKYADSSSDSEDSDSDEPQQSLSTRGKKQLQAPKEISDELDSNIDEKTGEIVDSDDNTPKRSTAEIATAGERSPSILKAVTVTAISTLKAKNGNSAAVLKQSRLETFCHLDQALQEGTTITPNKEAIMDAKAEVTTSALKANINKSTKRPRQVQGLEEDSKRSESNERDDESHIAKTPKRRKQVKSEQGVEEVKGATPPIAKNSFLSKGRGKQVQGGRAKLQKSTKEKKLVTASAVTPKGKRVASKSVRSSKKSFDTEEEESDPEVASDDSEDEDYIG